MTQGDLDIGKLAISTEEKIKLAAARVFTQKGYSATTTRDIAEVADITLGSLHYYFRTKEKLFQIISKEAMVKFGEIMQEIFADEIPLDQKIQLFANRYIDFFRKNPFLPMFILSESERNPEEFYGIVDFKAFNIRLKKQLEEMAEQGKIRPIKLEDFISTLVGLTVFPFLSKHMMFHAADLNEEEFQQMLERRKQLVPKLMIHHLYLP